MPLRHEIGEVLFRTRLLLKTVALLLLLSSGWLWAGETTDEDMRVTINKFQLNGFTAHPDRGISTDHIIKLLRHNQIFYGQEISLAELHILSDKLTAYYHQQGFRDIQVFLPSQQLDGEIIHFNIEQVATTATPAATDKPASPKNDELIRVDVKHFVLQDFKQYPKQGITGKAVYQIIAKTRSQYGRQMTLEELQNIAAAVTSYYRQNGYPFSKAYIPPQKLTSGTVNIAIAEGRLGDIKVYNSTVYDDQQIRKPFLEQLGQALHKPTIEKNLAELRRYPGLKVFGYYSRGSKAGETRLNIKIRYQQQWYASLRADNYGSESTGENRLVGQVHINNPLKKQDKLTIGLQQSLDNRDGENNLYGLLRYTLPLGSMNDLLTLTVTNSEFEIGDSFSTLDLKGEARIYRAAYSHLFETEGNSHHLLSLALSHKTSDLESEISNLTIELDEESTAGSLSWQNNWLSGNRRLSSTFNAIYTNGEFDMETTNTKGQHFDKFNLILHSQYSAGNPKNSSFSILKLHIASQFSEQRLPTLEQILLAGPHAVRAIKSGYFSADRGGYARLEWHLPVLLNNWLPENFSLTPYFFGDIAHGEKLGLDDTVIDRATISGYGFGLNLRWKDRFTLTASVQEIDDVDSDIQYPAEKRSVLIETQYLMP
jgi:hemolysin activation/secretion protein